MPEEFLDDVDRRSSLTQTERDVLSSVDVRNYEDLHSVVQAFPSLATAGVNMAKISNLAHLEVKEGFAQFARDTADRVRTVGLGAMPPPEAAFTRDAIVGAPPPRQKAVSGQQAAAIDLRLNDWPVRNQEDRGTCVSFGTAACVEHYVGGAGPDLSEQFLYWAMKTATADPYPNDDGSWLEYSRDALRGEGICLEGEWPYVGNVVRPVSGQTAAQPSAAVKASASGRRTTASFHQRNPRNAAAVLLAALKKGRPVAICLPVFADPLTPQGPTNWTTDVGWAYGHILNPPPTSKVIGGHCVCVTGYSPDRQEPTGGYFVVRNSWSTDWGVQNPNPGSHAPEPGYGFLSGTYVNTYTWELFQI